MCNDSTGQRTKSISVRVRGDRKPLRYQQTRSGRKATSSAEGWVKAAVSREGEGRGLTEKVVVALPLQVGRKSVGVTRRQDGK